MPGARPTDRLCRSESRQSGFSCDFDYPLVSRVRNVAQIANEIAALFKTEFFNRIDPNQSLAIYLQYFGVILRSGAPNNTRRQTKEHRELGEIRFL